VSLDAIDGTLADLHLRLAIIGLALFAASVVVAVLLTTVGLRSLRRVTAAADRIAAGDLDARAALPGGTDEIGRLGSAFDGMAERVDATLTAQRQFAADASHELRTPLTVLGGYVDVLSTADTDPATRARTLAAMRREIDRLSRLSQDLFLLTQLEAGGGTLRPREVDLGELIEDIAAAGRIIGPDRQIEVARRGPVPVIADPDRMTQALMNLVDNAVRHSPVGGTVRLSASQVDGHAVAEVWNSGQPIPAVDLTRVFDRFYRGPNGTASGSKGHAGLGLAIVRAIAEASGGSVNAASDDDGTTFSIRIPAAGTSQR
jgi:two-component system OmpR family sensor kinase